MPVTWEWLHTDINQCCKFLLSSCPRLQYIFALGDVMGTLNWHWVYWNSSPACFPVTMYICIRSLSLSYQKKAHKAPAQPTKFFLSCCGITLTIDFILMPSQIILYGQYVSHQKKDWLGGQLPNLLLLWQRSQTVFAWCWSYAIQYLSVDNGTASYTERQNLVSCSLGNCYSGRDQMKLLNNHVCTCRPIASKIYEREFLMVHVG